MCVATVFGLMTSADAISVCVLPSANRCPDERPNVDGLPSRGVAKHQVTELATGERVVSERVPGVRSVALGFWIGAGSRDEPDARAGVTHFIEHLLFKGTSRYSAQEIAEIFDELGGELNAATSRETTVVYARVPDDRLERALDVMADMVYRPTFTDVDSEREVVLEEIAMVDDTPHDLVHDIAAEAVFGGHPLGRPVIGQRGGHLERLAPRARRVPRPRLRGRAARPGGGGERPPRRSSSSCSSARRNGAAQGNGLAPQARCDGSPPPAIRFRRKDTEQYHVCLSAPGIARHDERRFAGSLLDAIVGGSASSRLFQEIREKRGMAYSVYSYASQYADDGPGRRLRRHARGATSRSASRSRSRELADLAAGQRARRRARAGEGEPQGPDPALARVDVDPHDPARQGDA